MNRLKIKKTCMIIIMLQVFFCTGFVLANQSTAKIGNNTYTWYNLPDGLKAQEPPSSEHIKETKSMRATVYGLFGDIAKGSCTGGISQKNGYQICKDQLNTSYDISPKFDEAVDKNIIPRIVATAYSKNGNKFEIPRGTLIYVKSNVSGVEDYGYAVVGDTGGGVEKGRLDLYMPYAANSSKSNEAEKYNFGLNYRDQLGFTKEGSITVYVTKYNLDRDKYVYIVPEGEIQYNSNTSISTNSTGLNSKITYDVGHIISTSGIKPDMLTANCKDAVEGYWSQITSVIGENQGNIGNSGASGEIFNTNPGSSVLSKSENNSILSELFDGNIPTNSAEMSKWLVSVQVPYLDKNGNRKIRSLQVHKKLAQNFINALTELADSGFKAYSLGTYCWRKVNNGSGSNTLSQHSYGVAIDINPNENYYPGVTSGLYKPGVNEYSLTEKEITIMNKYGFRWGGNYKDYMHFSISGR